MVQQNNNINFDYRSKANNINSKYLLNISKNRQKQ